MVRRSCDGNGLLEAYRAAVANLEAHIDEVNGLNVYPVPDGDTGSNMTSAPNSYVSSSLVKEIASFGGDVSTMVPAAAQDALRQAFERS